MIYRQSTRSNIANKAFITFAIISACCRLATSDEPKSVKVSLPIGISLKNCDVEFDRIAVLGAPVPGVIQDALVQPGDRVKIDQILGRLQTPLVEAGRGVAEVDAENVIGIQLQENLLKQAILKVDVNRPLVAKHYCSAYDFRLMELQVENARLNIDQAKFQRRMAFARLKEAEAEIRIREYRAPFEGLVVDVLKSAGEAVGYRDPVFRIVKDDRLRVIGYLDLSDAWHVEKDQEVRIIPEIEGIDLAIEREVFQGKIAFVNMELDAVNQVCKVVAIAENRNRSLRSGLKVRMEILPRQVAQAAPIRGITVKQ